MEPLTFSLPDDLDQQEVIRFLCIHVVLGQCPFHYHFCFILALELGKIGRENGSWDVGGITFLCLIGRVRIGNVLAQNSCGFKPIMRVTIVVPLTVTVVGSRSPLTSWNNLLKPKPCSCCLVA